MQTYTCPSCKFHFSEADKVWDSAIDSGWCPECLQVLQNFPVRTKQESLPPLRNFLVRPKQQEKTPHEQQSKTQEERPATQLPYPWGSVLTWVFLAFLLGLVTAHPPWKSASTFDRVNSGALRVMTGIVFAVFAAATVGSWKYFKRTPSSFFGATGFTGLFSVNTWKRISAEDAKKHPLYGVRGWLVFFAISTLGFLKPLVAVNEVAIKAGVSLGMLLAMPETSLIKQILAIQIVGWLVICWLLFSKHKSFRPVSSCILLGLWPAVYLAAFLNQIMNQQQSISGLGVALVLDFITWAVSCAVWVTYLQKSKRVRVTYEHSVKAGHDNVAGTSHLPSDPRPAVTREPALERQFNDDSSGRRMQAIPAGTSKAISPTQPTANPIAPVSIPAEPSQNTIEAHEARLYEQIAQELDTNTVDKGLWTKAYAQAGGDDKQTRVLYIKARFARLLAMQDS